MKFVNNEPKEGTFSEDIDVEGAARRRIFRVTPDAGSDRGKCSKGYFSGALKRQALGHGFSEGCRFVARTIKSESSFSRTFFVGGCA